MNLCNLFCAQTRKIILKKIPKSSPTLAKMDKNRANIAFLALEREIIVN